MFIFEFVKKCIYWSLQRNSHCWSTYDDSHTWHRSVFLNMSRGGSLFCFHQVWLCSHRGLQNCLKIIDFTVPGGPPYSPTPKYVTAPTAISSWDTLIFMETLSSKFIPTHCNYKYWDHINIINIIINKMVVGSTERDLH